MSVAVASVAVGGVAVGSPAVESVAVIPARGGSRRIPRKNVRAFAGRPMIAWSIDAAHASGLFRRVVVSTDDTEIADVARDCGAEVPFMRPAELADDHATTLAVMVHAVNALGLVAANRPALVCCLYATAPLVTVDDLRAGHQKLLDDPAALYAVSVTRYGYPIERALRITAAGRLEMRDPSRINVRSQDLEPAYHDAGQFYWGRASAFAAQVPMLGPQAAPVMLPEWRVADIDTPDDWQRAEHLFGLVHRPGGPGHGGAGTR